MRDHRPSPAWHSSGCGSRRPTCGFEIIVPIRKNARPRGEERVDGSDDLSVTHCRKSRAELHSAASFLSRGGSNVALGPSPTVLCRAGLAPGHGDPRGSRASGHGDERHVAATRVPAPAELLPCAWGLHDVRRPANQGEAGRPTIGFQDRLRRRLRGTPPEARAQAQSRQLRVPGGIDRDVHSRRLSRLHGRDQAPRRISGLAAESRSVLPAGSPRGGQPGDAHLVGKRLVAVSPGHVQGQRRVRPQTRPRCDRIDRVAVDIDRSSASSGRADLRDHRDRGVESGSHSPRAD